MAVAITAFFTITHLIMGTAVSVGTGIMVITLLLVLATWKELA